VLVEPADLGVASHLEAPHGAPTSAQAEISDGRRAEEGTTARLNIVLVNADLHLGSDGPVEMHGFDWAATMVDVDLVDQSKTIRTGCHRRWCVVVGSTSLPTKPTGTDRAVPRS
jgi:hypothetical protein